MIHRAMLWRDSGCMSCTIAHPFTTVWRCKYSVFRVLLMLVKNVRRSLNKFCEKKQDMTWKLEVGSFGTHRNFLGGVRKPLTSWCCRSVDSPYGRVGKIWSTVWETGSNTSYHGMAVWRGGGGEPKTDNALLRFPPSGHSSNLLTGRWVSSLPYLPRPLPWHPRIMVSDRAYHSFRGV